MRKQQIDWLLPVLLTLTYCQCSFAGIPRTNSSTNASFRESPCPNAEDIAPCVCTYNIEYEFMDMNCSGVSDEQQLHDVFHADDITHIYRELWIVESPIRTLSDDVFGEASFERVYIDGSWEEGGMLTSVGPNTFNKSVSTLTTLSIRHNQLTDFPFETLEEYSVLRTLVLLDNPLRRVPVTIRSESLNSLYLQWTWISSIVEDAFNGLPNIFDITMYNSRLFHLKSLQFSLTSPHTSYIDLKDNFIDSVEPNTFKGVQSAAIVLSNNKLTTLPEATWKSVLEAMNYVELVGNDFTCGCDIAWLVLEPAYHEYVTTARCDNGIKLVDLDPYFYENNCTLVTKELN